MGKLKKKFHQTRVYRVPLNSHTIPVSALVTSMAYTPSARVTVKSRVPVRVREPSPFSVQVPLSVSMPEFSAL